MRSSRLPTRRARVSCPEVEPPPAHQIRRTERRSTATGPERRRTYSRVRRASRPRTLPAGYRRATSKTPSTRVRQRSHVWPVHHSKRLSGLDHSSAPPSARFFGAVRKRTGAQNVAQRQTPSAAPESRRCSPCSGRCCSEGCGQYVGQVAPGAAGLIKARIVDGDLDADCLATRQGNPKRGP
ncbi:hypothetical protein ACVII0_000414 [Sinorhizobium meliloti]